MSLWKAAKKVIKAIWVVYGIYLLYLLVVNVPRPSWPAPTPTLIIPVQPVKSGAGSNNEIVPCGDIVVLTVSKLHVNQIPIDQPFATSNRVKVVVLLMDKPETTLFNYHVEPIPVQDNTDILLGRFHTAIEVESHRPVMAWILLVDDNQVVPSERLLRNLWGALASMWSDTIKSAQLYPNMGEAAEVVQGVALGEFLSELEKDRIVGDNAFALTEENQWGEGQHVYQSPNKAIDVNFSVTHYANCAPISPVNATLTPPRPAPEAKPALKSCQTGGLLTRLRVEDMAVISVPDGWFLFFRDAPNRASSGLRYAPGHILRIVDGPSCDGTFMFWKVLDWRGEAGWVAESGFDTEANKGVYYLQPYTRSNQ